jgi:hypothetical protein
MSSTYRSPGGPGCPPECFIDRYAPTMWVEEDRARRAHAAHTAAEAELDAAMREQMTHDPEEGGPRDRAIGPHPRFREMDARREARMRGQL